MQKIGKYEIEGKLGSGAMGVVFKARDPVLDRPVAIKVISQSLVDEPELRDRFLSEARAAGNLRHPNIILIYDCAEQDGIPYIVMEYLEGHDLDGLIGPSSEIPLDRRLGFVRQVCAGVQHAHQARVVHRDLKPANVRILPDGTAKVMDFGIARVGDSNKTQTGTVMGTASYMSPEQCVSSKVGPQTDVWSAGVILYELVTCSRPYQGDTAFSIMRNITALPPAPLSRYLESYPAELEEILSKSMAKDPQQRYPSIGQLGEDLQKLEALLLDGTAQPVVLRSKPAAEQTVVVEPTVRSEVAGVAAGESESASGIHQDAVSPPPQQASATVLVGSPGAGQAPRSQPYAATQIAQPAPPVQPGVVKAPAGSGLAQQPPKPGQSKGLIPLLALAGLAILLLGGGLYLYVEDPFQLFTAELVENDDPPPGMDSEVRRDLKALLHGAYYGGEAGIISAQERARIDELAARRQVSAQQIQELEEEVGLGWRQANAFFQEGVKQAQSGNLQSAIEQLEKARSADGDSAWVLANLAMAYLADRQLGRAEKFVAEASRLDPRLWLACYVQATLFVKQGRMEQALDQLFEARRYVESGSPRARTQFMQGLRNDPDLEGVRGEPRFQELLQ